MNNYPNFIDSNSKVLNLLEEYSKNEASVEEFEVLFDVYESYYRNIYELIVYEKNSNPDWSAYRKEIILKYYREFFSSRYEEYYENYKNLRDTTNVVYQKFKCVFGNKALKDVDIFIAPSLRTHHGRVYHVNRRSTVFLSTDYSFEDPLQAKAFIAHELFHGWHMDHHFSLNSKDMNAAFLMLMEGLAVFAAELISGCKTHIFFPITSDEDMEKNYLCFVNKYRIEFLKIMEDKVFDPSNLLTTSNWFYCTPRDNGVPPNYGYFLGYIVSKILLKEYTISELVSFNQNVVTEIVFDCLKQDISLEIYSESILN